MTVLRAIYQQIEVVKYRIKQRQLDVITGKQTQYFSNNVFDQVYNQIQCKEKTPRTKIFATLTGVLENILKMLRQFIKNQYDSTKELFFNILIIVVSLIDLSYSYSCFVHLDHCMHNTHLLYFMQYSYIIIVFYTSIEFIYMLKNFQPFQILIGVINYIFKRIIHFMIILVIFVIIFTLVFYLQQINGFWGCKGNDTTNCKKELFGPDDKGSLYKMFRYTFLLVLGDYSDLLKGDSYDDDIDNNSDYFADDLVRQYQGYVMFVCFIFAALFLQIVFLNLLIAMVTDFYQEFQGFQKKNYTFNLTKIMSKINFTMYQQNSLIKQYKYNSNFLFICINSNDRKQFEETYEDDSIYKIVENQNQIKQTIDDQMKDIEYNTKITQQVQANSQYMSSCLKQLMNKNTDESKIQSRVLNKLLSTFKAKRANTINLDKQQSVYNEQSPLHKSGLQSDNSYSDKNENQQQQNKQLPLMKQQLDEHNQLLQYKLNQFQQIMKTQSIQQQQQIQQQQEQIQQQIECQENVQSQQQQMDSNYQHQLDNMKRQLSKIDEKIKCLGLMLRNQ